MDCHLAEQIIWAFGLWVLYGSTNPWTASRAEHGGVFFIFMKSQGCIKFICPCLHREIFPKINVHFWRIHVGASGSCSLREEYTLGLMLLASLAISGRFAAFGLSQVGFGLILCLCPSIYMNIQEIRTFSAYAIFIWIIICRLEWCVATYICVPWTANKAERLHWIYGVSRNSGLFYAPSWTFIWIILYRLGWCIIACIHILWTAGKVEHLEWNIWNVLKIRTPFCTM